MKLWKKKNYKGKTIKWRREKNEIWKSDVSNVELKAKLKKQEKNVTIGMASQSSRSLFWYHQLEENDEVLWTENALNLYVLEGIC